MKRNRRLFPFGLQESEERGGMKVKICGIKRREDIRAAYEAGADAIGLNFYRGSPRYVSLDEAVELVRHVPTLMDVVAVFVHPSSATVRDICLRLGITSVQIHGRVNPRLIADLAEFQVIRAFQLRDEDSLDDLVDELEMCHHEGKLPSALLVDAWSEKQYGGTGRTAPWDLARRIAGLSPVPVFLAGGLTPENVADAVRAVRPAGVDVASGVELEPGIKDHQKLRLFVQNAKKAAAELGLL